MANFLSISRVTLLILTTKESFKKITVISFNGKLNINWVFDYCLTMIRKILINEIVFYIII